MDSKVTIEAVSAVKIGRCFNGSERDKGTVVHLVKPMPDNSNGDWFTKALCGTYPGLRGNGWKKSDKEATCLKCLKLNNNSPHLKISTNNEDGSPEDILRGLNILIEKFTEEKSVLENMLIKLKKAKEKLIKEQPHLTHNQ